jgi:hypothetical protein
MQHFDLFQKLIATLDPAVSFADTAAAWKTLKKAAPELVKPLAPHFKAGDRPFATSLLQWALSTPELRPLVEATLKAHPRELWEVVQETPVASDFLFIGDRLHGTEPRLLLQPHSKSWVIYDARDLSVIEVIKPTSLSSVVFADGGLRALDGGKVLTRAAGQKKWTTVHDFGEVSEIALAPKVAAAVQNVSTGEGDEAREHQDLLVCLLDTGVETRHRLPEKTLMCPSLAGTTVVVGATDSTFFVSERGGAPVERQLPRPEVVENMLDVEGTLWLDARGPWRRLSDLSEGWGPNFGDPEVVGGAAWSRTGERIENGQRSSPIRFLDSDIRGVMALNDRELVILRMNNKDKRFLVRLRRFC